MLSEHKLFVGFECEGRWSGLPTIFVPAALLDNVDAQTVVSAHAYRHIYLGSGSNTIKPHHWADVDRWVNHDVRLENHVFTLEVAVQEASDIPAWAGSLDRVRVILSDTVTRGVTEVLLRPNVEVKLQEETRAVMYFQPSQSIALTYNRDKEL